MTTLFYQPCPACNRSLEIDVVLFGEEVRCGHCGKIFVATGKERARHEARWANFEAISTTPRRPVRLIDKS